MPEFNAENYNQLREDYPEEALQWLGHQSEKNRVFINPEDATEVHVREIHFREEFVKVLSMFQIIKCQNVIELLSGRLNNR